MAIDTLRTPRNERIPQSRRSLRSADRVPAAVWRLGAVIAFGAFTSQLDTSVVNVGIDTLGRELHASLTQVQWVSNGYLLALAVALPLTGWLGRRVGTGRLWLTALAGFTIVSGLCAAAPAIGWLIALRVAQGLTAGLLVPSGQAILGNAAGPQRLGRVMGALGIAVSLAPALGPVAGALVLHAASWRWLFLINLPIGITGLLLGRRVVPRGEPGAATPLDWTGFALIGISLPLVVYAVTRIGEQATLGDPSLLVPLLLGAVGLATFAARARHQRAPLLDLGLYRQPIYAAASAAATFTGAALFGAALLYPLYFQIARGESVLNTGLSLISLGAGTAVMSPLSGRLTDRFSAGPVAVAGSGLSVISTIPFALAPTHANPAVLQALLLLRGATIALASTPVITAAYAAVRPEQLPDATTQVNILQRLGGAIGGAALAVIVARGASHGAGHTFHLAFWWLTGFTALALVAAIWLHLASRHSRANDASVKPAQGGPVGRPLESNASPRMNRRAHMIRIAIIVGSLRPGRNATQVAQWVHQHAIKRKDASFELVDIADYNLPHLDEPTPPAISSQYHHPHTQQWSQTISAFDAFIFVTSEYNHSAPAALKNAIDFLWHEWNDKAAGFVSYGLQGGTRAVEHLRLVMSELKIADVRTQVALSLFDDFENMSELRARPHHQATLDRMLEELVSWGTALKRVRDAQPSLTAA